MYDINQKNWYVIQTFSGFENNIVEKIKKQIKRSNSEKLFGKIMIPGNKLIELKLEKKKNSEYKFFPGYILINMHMNERSWNLIKNIPKVIKFIGNISDKPAAININEIKKINKKIKTLEKNPHLTITFTPGEKVRINNGPFSGFKGIVEEVDYIKNRLKVSVLIFGRSTPVELNFNQIEKY